ncbi:hypothetical protein [Actinoplanes sp. M2I2]|uniref:TRAFAC clade GTPase domain-containing protein n=1 Tax=Actinoplanes sp. M2I2 TaxID=1734444 RepID=UPI0027DF710E|nr:hypothetical protein [Actinoplanes sp. M2I2]
MSETGDQDSGVTRFREGMDKFVFYVLVAAVVLLFLLFPLVTIVSLVMVSVQGGRALLDGVRNAPAGSASEEGTTYPPYLQHRLWPDFKQLSGQGAETARARLERASNDAAHWFARPGTKQLLIPVRLAYRLGWGLAVAVLAISSAVVAVLLAVIWLLLSGSRWAAGWLLRGVDAALGWRRRIRTTCPHSSCWRKINQAEYLCPGTRDAADPHVHTDLRPNRFGVLWHVCRLCNRRLPTATVLGRHRLTARCPHCHQQLPARTGRVPIEPIPIIGGTGAGKTTYLTLALHELTGSFHGAVTITDPAQHNEQERRHQELRAGNTRPTQRDMPTAVVADVSRVGRGGRILTIFDAAGELFRDESRTTRLGYLRHVRSLMVVVDPGAVAELHEVVRDSRPTATGPDPSRDDPVDVLRAVLLKILKDRSTLDRIAVVITKGDLLNDSIVGRPADGDEARAWLIDRNLRPLVDRLERVAREKVRYVTSDRDTDDDGHRRADLLLWLAHEDRSRSPLGQPATSERIRVPAGHAGDPPLSYRAGRKAILGLYAVGLGALPIASTVLAMTVR